MKGLNKKGFMYKDIKGFFLGELGMASQCILETTKNKGNLYIIITKLIHEIAKLDYQPLIIKDIRLKDKITIFFYYCPSGRNCFSDEYYTKYFNSYIYNKSPGEFKKYLQFIF